MLSIWKKWSTKGTSFAGKSVYKERKIYCALENHVLWAWLEFSGYAWKYKQGVLEYWRTVEDPAVSGGVLE